MDWNTQTVQTYDQSAKQLAEYFKGIGARVEDIERALDLAGTESARVVEMGCGDGRDALEIVSRVSWYEGVDPSKGLLELAQAKLPDVSFVQADALSYVYPQDVDVIFAFASLLHVNKTDLVEVFAKAAQSLRSGGIFYISLKERDSYVEEVKRDEYGERMFYYYNAAIIKELAGNLFTSVYEARQTMGKTDWFTIALKRK